MRRELSQFSLFCNHDQLGGARDSQWTILSRGRGALASLKKGGKWRIL
jgi:hypothetical protein